MPFIKVKTNVEISDGERLKTLLGKVITVIPGKEEWMTMVSFEKNADLYLAGSNEPCAMVDTLVNEGTNHSKNTEYGNAVIDLISSELGIPRNRIYVIVQEQDFWYAAKV